MYYTDRRFYSMALTPINQSHSFTSTKPIKTDNSYSSSLPTSEPITDDSMPVPSIKAPGMTPTTLTTPITQRTSTPQPVLKFLLEQVELTENFTISTENQQVMSDALTYSGINTLEQARELGLEITPPGPVFTTWVARHGTAVFDGTNSPAHLKPYDLVSKIKHEARKLNKWGVPFILVFSTRNMPESEQKKMRENFNSNDNILLLELESDLQTIPGYSELCDIPLCSNPDFPTPFSLLDMLRFHLLTHFKPFLETAEKIAEKKGQIQLAKQIAKFEKKSIIYTDADNTFLEPPLFQITSQGIKQSIGILGNARGHFRHFMSHWEKNPENKAFAISVKTYEGFVHRTTALFNDEELYQHRDRLYQYITSNQFEEALTSGAYYSFTSMESLSPFDHDVGYFSIGTNGVHFIPTRENPVHSHEIYPTAKKYPALSRLYFLQQLHGIHIGRLETWRHPKNN